MGWEEAGRPFHSAHTLAFFFLRNFCREKNTFVLVSMGALLRNADLYQLRIQSLPTNGSTTVSNLPTASSDGTPSPISLLHNGGIRADGAAAREGVVGGVFRLHAGVDDDG